MKKFDKMLMGKRIRACRISRNLSQEKLADVFGMKRSNMSNYESGRRVPPSNVLFELAEYFSVPADYLLGRETDGLSDSLALENTSLKIALSDIELIIQREKQKHQLEEE